MSGRYKAYEEYKESGVEWLGEIPECWHINKMRYMFSFGKGLTITKENLMDEGIPCVNYGEVHSKFSFEVNPGKHFLKCVNPQYLITSPNSLLNKGDLVFADTSEDIEGSGNFTHLVSDDRLFAGYHTIIARPHESKNSRFYAYLFDCSQLRSQIKYSVKGVKVFSITQAILRAINIWLPSPEEQNQIAAFLDHETAKIDTLIDKQQQLIELLKEKRQAVISHAVTKGLVPDVPMKDSGVEWLGEIPQTWEMWKLAHAFEVIGSGTTPSSDNDSWFEGDIPWVTTGELRETVITHTIKKVSKLTLERFSALKIHPVGSVVIAMYGATIGRLGILGVKSTTNQACCVLTFSRVIDNKYLYYWLGGYKDDIIRLSSGGGQPNINQEKVASLKISSPILKEQTQIATFLDHETAKIDTLIDLQQQQIDLLKERRTALISAAVTGKIDVRDWQVPVTQTESDEVMA
ncbi:restriction endonuclease subunit S [Rahnella bonaserana]|uniref:restriction endonuclease subunit S n=1 Tax=Rahnella bonaserana TaxID=2816248 RepID=UPI0024C247E9|nr:restriction endonuclease subunit S [Rahnella bonaserana]WHZ41658.1 restriction endonuclease subunit S [Rahnella bonaserana]